VNQNFSAFQLECLYGGLFNFLVIFVTQCRFLFATFTKEIMLATDFFNPASDFWKYFGIFQSGLNDSSVLP
jgi:hypothetical protein